MLRSLAALTASILTLLPWASATACSFGPEHMPPSGFELVQISDAIVIATALEERPGEYGSVVAFDVGERVKGEAQGRVEVPGRLEDPRPGEPSYVAGPNAIYIGELCGPGPFRRGRRYLLLLEKGENGQLRRTAHSYEAGMEYSGENSDWVRIVRRYVRLQASAAPMERIAILERLARSRRGVAGEPLNDEEVDDIRDHLGSISPYKATAYLLVAYAALERGRLPAHAVRPRDRDLAAMKRRVLTALVNGDHPDAMPLFERLAAETPEDPDRIGLALRFLARNGAFGRAFRWVETRLMTRLPQLDRAAAKRLIGHVEQMQEGEEEGKEPWRSDARAAARWPELALSLYWYQVRRFGPDDAFNFSAALRTLPNDDYRARPLLTRALAADHDQDIAEWAVSELSDEKTKAWDALPENLRNSRVDPAELPLQVLLSAYEAKNQPLLEQVFCQSEARGLLLIRAFGEAGDSLYTDLIRNIAASAMTEKQRALLPGALAQWAERNKESLRSSIHSGLAADLRRGKQLGRPIDCGEARR